MITWLEDLRCKYLKPPKETTLVEGKKFIGDKLWGNLFGIESRNKQLYRESFYQKLGFIGEGGATGQHSLTTGTFGEDTKKPKPES